MHTLRFYLDQMIFRANGNYHFRANAHYIIQSKCTPSANEISVIIANAHFQFCRAGAYWQIRTSANSSIRASAYRMIRANSCSKLQIICSPSNFLDHMTALNFRSNAHPHIFQIKCTLEQMATIILEQITQIKCTLEQMATIILEQMTATRQNLVLLKTCANHIQVCTMSCICLPTSIIFPF